PGGEAVRLDAGQALATADTSPQLSVAAVSPADVGGWRERRLNYRQASLSTVAADLSRGLGVAIVTTPDVAAQRFTGAIAYADKARFLGQLGPLLDVAVQHDHDRWLLTRKAAPRH
ncbi:MAG TPA: iron dicitrate transport regulator FecR, partial [Sphingomonas sp.]|nr:iron dicitrate transport regulator FecR [Sphingomonas sp.]